MRSAVPTSPSAVLLSISMLLFAALVAGLAATAAAQDFRFNDAGHDAGAAPLHDLAELLLSADAAASDMAAGTPPSTVSSDEKSAPNNLRNVRAASQSTTTATPTTAAQSRVVQHVLLAGPRSMLTAVGIHEHCRDVVVALHAAPTAARSHSVSAAVASVRINAFVAALSRTPPNAPRDNQNSQHDSNHDSAGMNQCQQYLARSATIARRPLAESDKIDASLSPLVAVGKDRTTAQAVGRRGSMSELMEEQRRAFERVDLVQSPEDNDNNFHGTKQKQTRHHNRPETNSDVVEGVSSESDVVSPALQLLVFGHGRWFEHPPRSLARCRFTVLEVFDDADLGLGVAGSSPVQASSVENTAGNTGPIQEGGARNADEVEGEAVHSLALLAAAHTEIGAFVAVSATPGCVQALAAVPAVRRVEPRPVVTLHNAIATRTMQASVEVDLTDTRLGTPSRETVAAGDAVGRTVWDAGLTGEGELIAVSDTGLDIQSCFFHDPNETLAIWPKVNPRHRKVLTYRAATTIHDESDGHGHGTHVAGSVAGRSLSQYQRYNGIAPDAKLVVHDLHSPTTPRFDVPGDMALYFKRVAETGAKVCTGSWGGGRPLGYNAMDRRTDVFMARNPEMLAFFSAGNSATSGTSSPSKAKNVIAVGAHLNSFDMTRRDTLARFSSRMPLADGRLKPDVTGPGDAVVSAATSSSNRHCELLSARGTSMSTPLVAGAGLLIKQHLRVGSVGAARETKRPRPLAATVKALVVLGAHDMPGVTAETPNNDGEGFGRFRLAPVVGPDVVVREGVTDLAPLKTNQRSDLCIRVTTPAAGGAAKSLWGDLRAALVWTDSPIAVEGSDVTLVNDLDLSISDVDGAVVFGNTKASASNVASKPDRVNNVERVTLAAPAPGASKDYWVTVYAHDVQDDRPFGTWSGLNGSYTALGQPFSIAVGGPGVTVRDCATVLAETAAWKCPGNCNGRGACVAGKCQCNAGLSGVSCETCDPDVVCNGNGQCNPQTLQCTCNTTRFNVASDPKCSTCNAGFFGPHCAQRCDCEKAGHGTCDRMAGTCTCHAKWGGPLCDRCGKGWAHTALKLDGTPATPGAATQNCDVPSNWCGVDGAPVDVVVAAGTPVMFQPGDNIAVPTRTTCVWRFKSVDGAAASWLKLNLTHLHTFRDDATRVWQGWGDPLNSTEHMKLEQHTSSRHRGVVEGNGKVGLVVRFDSSEYFATKGFTGVVEAHTPPACDTLCEGGCGARGVCDCSGVAQCKCDASEALGFWGGGVSLTKCDVCADDYIRYPVSATGDFDTTAVECATPALWCPIWNTDDDWSPRKIVVGNTTDGKPGAAFIQPGIEEYYYRENCPWQIRIPPTETVNTWLTVTLTNIKINVNDNIIVHRGARPTDEVSDPPLLVVSAANNGNSTMTVSVDGRAGVTIELIANAYRFPGRGFIGRITAGPPPPTCEARCQNMCAQGTCSCDTDTGAPTCACPNDNTRGKWGGQSCSHCAAGRTWASFDSSAWAFKVPTPAVVTATTPSSEQLAATCTTPAATCIPDGTPVDVLVSNASGPVFLQVGNDVRYPNNIKCQWRIRAAPGERNRLPLSFAVPHADMGNDVVRVHLGQIDGFSASTPHPINKTTGKAPLFPVITTDIAAGFTVTFASDGEGNGRGFTAVAALREPPCDGFCQCSGHGVCSCTNSGTDEASGTCSCAQSTTAGFWAGENCNTCTRGWTSGTITPSPTDPIGCNKKALYCTRQLPTIIIDPADGPLYLLATDKSRYDVRLNCGWRIKAKPGSKVPLTVSVAQLDTFDFDPVRAIDGQPEKPFDVPKDHATVKFNVSGTGYNVATATASDPEMGMVVIFRSANWVGRSGFVVAVNARAATGSESDSTSDEETNAPVTGAPASGAALPGTCVVVAIAAAVSLMATVF